MEDELITWMVQQRSKNCRVTRSKIKAQAKELSKHKFKFIGESYERFVRKRPLVKYQFQSEVIKVML